MANLPSILNCAAKRRLYSSGQRLFCDVRRNYSDASELSCLSKRNSFLTNFSSSNQFASLFHSSAKTCNSNSGNEDGGETPPPPSSLIKNEPQEKNIDVKVMGGIQRASTGKNKKVTEIFPLLAF